MKGATAEPCVRTIRVPTSTSTTVGVNWYLSSVLELRFNYVFASVTGRAPGGQVNIFQTRLGMSF